MYNSRAETAKKCSKKCAARAKLLLLFFLTFSLLFASLDLKPLKTFLSDAGQREVDFFHYEAKFLPKFLDKSSL